MSRGPADDHGLPRAGKARLNERCQWLTERARAVAVERCPGRGSVHAFVAQGDVAGEDCYWVILAAYCGDHCGFRTNEPCRDDDFHPGLVTAGANTSNSALHRFRRKLEILFPVPA